MPFFLLFGTTNIRTFSELTKQLTNFNIVFNYCSKICKEKADLLSQQIRSKSKSLIYLSNYVSSLFLLIIITETLLKGDAVEKV
jgi:hypothetical protein